MKIEGLRFIFDEIAKMQAGICATCEAPLLTPRQFTYTCDNVCHHAWIERLVRLHGETTNLTDAKTGKVYAVPTRVILETGVTTSTMKQYPEVMR